MSAIPSTFGRVPTLLSSQISSRNIAGTNAALLRLQEQLSSGQRLNRPSDDAVASALVGVLDMRIEAGTQRSRNLDHAGNVLDTLDQSFGSLSDAVLEAKTIASSQLGVGSDPETRASQAAVVESLIDQVFNELNRSFAGIHLYGGSRVGQRPFEGFFGGYRYVGEGEGLRTDLGEGIDFPITVDGGTAVGAVSARHEGDVDLDPVLTGATRVRDLRGPAVGNLPLGSLEVTLDDGTPVTVEVDLSSAETMADVAEAIDSAVLAADPGAFTGGFGTNVGFAGERLTFGNIAAGYTVTFADGPSGSTATALGLGGFNYDAGNPTSTVASGELNPALTDETTLAALNPAAAVVYGDIVFENGGRSGTVTTSAGMTVGELREQVRRLGIGVRMEINGDGDRLDVVNEVSGFRMSVSEGGSTAATTLGIRTLSASTLLSEFNDGRGVQIADGQINPLTGLPDADRNVDFEVTLTDGSSFVVDLTPADTGTVADVLAKINADAAAAGLGGVFNATLGTGGNGIVFEDTAGGGGSVGVTSLNGYAAEDLGLLGGTFSAGAPATFAGADAAEVRVDSVLSTLIDLREALVANDERGITFAGEGLEREVDRLATSRALVGGRSARVSDAAVRLEDTMILDRSVRSDLRDLDYVEASTRFSVLQTQLQAGMTAAVTVRSLTLLNFLG